MPQSKQTFDSNELHNQNCYRYLKVLTSKMTPRLWNIFESNSSIKLGSSSHQFKIVSAQTTYDAKFAYADLYSNLLTEIENNLPSLIKALNESIFSKLESIKLSEEMGGADLIDSRKAVLEKEKTELAQERSNFDDLIFTIYANDNHNLEHTFAAFKNLVVEGERFQTKIKKSVTRGLTTNNTATMPTAAGSAPGRFIATFTSNFKPQLETSLATIRHYAYQQQTNRSIEYRFGTQGQRHQGTARVSPLFEYWLTVLKKTHNNPSHSIDHIYFNNLGLYRDDMEGTKEKALTLVLHDLEITHDNIAMITLPADKFLMESTNYKHTEAELDYSSIFNEFFNIATHKKSLDKVEHDFYISSEIKAILYQGTDKTYSRAIEKDVINKLLNKSFTAMGIDKTKKLSLAQKQAVWFYFIKFELTDFIIETLHPQSISFVCKDAIDRGGVASAFYNLIKSFKLDQPLTREEFDQALQAAPVMVKGRGMNHQIDIIWNTINQYVNANKVDIFNNSGQQWLIDWRNDNQPKESVTGSIKKSVKKTIDGIFSPSRPSILPQASNPYAAPPALTLATENEKVDEVGQPSENTSAIVVSSSSTAAIAPTLPASVNDNARKLDALISTHLLSNAKDGEALSLAKESTKAVINNPTLENVKQYEKVAEKIEAENPYLMMFTGIMKMIAGGILAAITMVSSVGAYCYTDLFNSGLTTFSAGRKARVKEEVVVPQLVIDTP